MKARARIPFVVMLLALPACGAAAEEAEVPKPASRFRDPADGQIDLSALLAKPRNFLPIPLVVTEPAIGYGGGMAAMFLRPRKNASDGYARPNMSILGGIATENGTWAAFAGDSSRWLGDRMQTLAAGGGGRLNLDFYGLGNDSDSLDDPVSYSLDFALMFLQGDWKVRPDSPWSAGLRYIYANVEPSLRDAPPQAPGFLDDADIKISAPAAVFEYDTRNNLFTPTKGLFAESVYLSSFEDLGASEDFERFQQVVMGWIPLSDTWTLGLRGDYQWSSDGTPFFLRPYIKLRGVQAMRYQGDEMASAELEARWKVHGRWSLIGAAGYGSARTERELFTKNRDIVSGAVGFRYELARKFGLHAGMDVGFSDGTTAIYFQIGNAWFRP